MAIDSKVIEAEKIKHIQHRNRINISIDLIGSSLAHIFFAWAVLGFPTISFFKPEHKHTQQKTINVTLHQDYEVEKSSETYSSKGDTRFEPLAYNPKETLVEGIQTYVPADSVIFARNIDLDFKLSSSYISPELKIKDVQRMLEETYLAFRKTQLYKSNKASYYKYFESFSNHHLPQPEIRTEFYRDILPILKKNSSMLRITFDDIRFNGNGIWEVVRFGLMPGFVDENGKVLNFYRKLLDELPKEFIPPEIAGLQSPFQARYWFINLEYQPTKH